MPPEGCTGTGILPGCPSLDRGNREPEVGFELWTLRSVNSRLNPLVIPPLSIVKIWKNLCVPEQTISNTFKMHVSISILAVLGQPGSIPALVLPSGGMAARHRKCATAERCTIYYQISNIVPTETRDGLRAAFSTENNITDEMF
ncbi:hypothetical protein T265_14115, partial [Opisthorchis viverrini]